MLLNPRNSFYRMLAGDFSVRTRELHMILSFIVRAINGLFGANCSKATKFGPDVDRTLLDRFRVNDKKSFSKVLIDPPPQNVTFLCDLLTQHLFFMSCAYYIK